VSFLICFELSEIDCLKRLVSKMTCYVSSGMYNSASYSLS